MVRQTNLSLPQGGAGCTPFSPASPNPRQTAAAGPVITPPLSSGALLSRAIPPTNSAEDPKGLRRRQFDAPVDVTSAVRPNCDARGGLGRASEVRSDEELDARIVVAAG